MRRGEATHRWCARKGALSTAVRCGIGGGPGCILCLYVRGRRTRPAIASKPCFKGIATAGKGHAVPRRSGKCRPGCLPLARTDGPLIVKSGPGFPFTGGTSHRRRGPVQSRHSSRKRGCKANEEETKQRTDGAEQRRREKEAEQDARNKRTEIKEDKKGAKGKSIRLKIRR